MKKVHAFEMKNLRYYDYRSKLNFRVIVLLLMVSVIAKAQIYVSPTGDDANPGTIDLPFKTLTKAITAAGPDSLIYMRGGTYSISSTITTTKSGLAGKYIKVWAYPGETPVLDFSTESLGSRGILVSADYWHFKGLEIKNAGDNGIYISGGHNKVEQCVIHENQDSGVQISGAGNNNLIINCDSYLNYDSATHGGNADGFAPKLDVGPGNEFHGCRSWNNSDDGWDCYGANYGSIIESCWTFRNGINVWGDAAFAGNGNGFKVGGNYTIAAHTVTNCVAFDNAVKGFDQNHNAGGVTVSNCIAWRNQRSYWFPDTLRSGENVIRNNISFQATSTPTSFNSRFTVQAANSWQGFTVTTADFLSMDTSLATAPRNPDGSLPSNDFFHLASGSSLIDAGVYAWIPYNGPAPDLGAFESPGPAAPKFTLSVNATNGSVTKNPALAQYDSGAAVPCTAVPSDGYYFVGWADGLTGTENPDTILMNGNKTVTANFAVIVGLTGSFRTHQSGNWSDVASWERFDGSAWINPAPSVPTSSDGAITILGGHAITVDTNVTVDQVVVNANGSVIVAAGKTLTVADGVDSIDMVVNGTLNNFGTVTPTGRLSFENGGLYIHSVPSGGTTLPSSTWRVGSTCRIDGSSGSSPTNLNTQALYNLTWNATSQGANGGPNFGDGAVIYGDLTVTSTKSFQWRIVNLSGGQTKNVYIRGNIYVNGSTALLTATGSGADSLAKAIINVNGDVNVSAGQWSLNNSSAAYTEWKVSGNINITGGTLQSGSSGWYGRRTLNFAGGGTQAFTVSAPGTIGTAPTTFKVSNNSVVQVNFPFSLMASGGLSLAGGQFVTTATNLITVPAGGSVTGGSSSSYVNGPLALIVASSSPTVKTFPVGKGTSYRPITLSVNQDAATATTYTAEVFNTAPAARTLPPALSAVSSVRYYHIAKGAGANLSPTLGATVQLSYDTDDLVTDATILRVAKDDGAGNWINGGGSGTANTTGTITSNAFFSFSDFVLATADTSVHAVLPTVATTAMSYISTTFAAGGGNITNDGGGAVTARGVCWNTTGTPTILNSKTSDGTGAGLFTSSLTGLTPGATYHVRAYGTNSTGTGYGNEVIFSTLASLVPPTVTTTSISSIQVTTAIGGGNVTDWGGDSVTARGVCWSITNSPTLSGNHSVDGSGLGSFASGLSPLAGGTKYYVRAYATNSAGTGYGDTVSFTTQTPANDTTVIVAKDGSGNYTTVQAAFRAVPANYTGKWTIFVKKGTYYEKDTLASGKINVVLMGEDRDSTIITYDDYADRYGSGNPGTSGSFTIAVDASDFTAKNITFRNTYSPQSGVTGTQAVALRTQGDRHEYVNCKILGYQDTYYTWGGSATGRQYHKNCFIEGSVDFIFGRNIVVFDSCTIHEIRNGGTVTAGSTDAASRYGYVFRNCTILADAVGYDGNPLTSFYLGRPWQGSPRTVFLNCSEPSNLNAAGWLAWNVTPALYAEYNCFGPGSPSSGRVAWSSQLAGPAAAAYSLSNIFARSSAVSSLILYDWMPASAGTDQPLLLRITASAGAHGSITPPGVASVAYGGGQTYSLIPDAGYHVTDVLVDGVSVGATAGYTFTNVTANRTITANFGTNTYPVTVNQRWNMLSVPCTVPDRQKVILFPHAVSKAFAYTGTYVIRDTLVNGVGYWLKFPAKETVMTACVDRLCDTVTVSAGWNMIGSISVPVRVESIASIPPHMVAGNFFGYGDSYNLSDTIYPGKGYWVKVNRDGSLILSATQTGLTSSARIRIVPTGEMPPAPPGLGPPDGGALPPWYSLDRNYPNPFNPSTTIVVGFPRAGRVRLVVYDILGREVRTLLDEERSAGYHTIEWNGLTNQNVTATSGIYFVRMIVDNFSAVQKIVLMR